MQFRVLGVGIGCGVWESWFMVYDFIVGKWNGDHVLLQGCYLQDWAMGLWFKLSKLGV